MIVRTRIVFHGMKNNMALMHFYAQMGMIRLGPYLLSMPDEMDEADRIAFTDAFHGYERDPYTFEKTFANRSEKEIIEHIMQMAETFLNDRYPMPTEEVYHSFRASDFFQKDYYLPALKVLNYRDGEYFSPARPAKWTNMQLKGVHLDVEENDPTDPLKYVAKTNKDHIVGPTCDCGIYGSVNVEELSIYLNSDGVRSLVQMDPHFGVLNRKLCIIEPSNKADVYLARKGWKTTHAFISEVIGDTISVNDASELLSMVWKRKVDVMKVYTMKGRVE